MLDQQRRYKELVLRIEENLYEGRAYGSIVCVWLSKLVALRIIIDEPVQDQGTCIRVYRDEIDIKRDLQIYERGVELLTSITHISTIPTGCRGSCVLKWANTARPSNKYPNQKGKGYSEDAGRKPQFTSYTSRHMRCY